MTDVFDKLAAADSEADGHKGPTSRESEEGNEAVQYTSQQLKDTCQELLKYGLLEMESKPNLYRIAQTQTEQVNNILEPLDLALKVDDIRGLAYVAVADHAKESGDEWTHPLVRRQRLNLEQSLLLAILRQHYIAHEQESGLGARDAVVALEELIPQLQVYLGDPGSEQADDSRVRNLLDKLKSHGVVSEVDSYDQIRIRPIITHLADPEGLQSLLDTLKELATSRKETAEESE